jgi:hypothetical protein
VVIRLGPSKSVATLLWDRKRNTFHMGQWLKGRIYERRCDLSPDGKHLIFFAMRGRCTSPSSGSWSAIPCAPWKLQQKDLFEIKIGKSWGLRKPAHAEIGAPEDKSAYWDEHELILTVEGLTIPCPSWEWAKLDGNRLV